MMALALESGIVYRRNDIDVQLNPKFAGLYGELYSKFKAQPKALRAAVVEFVGAGREEKYLKELCDAIRPLLD